MTDQFDRKGWPAWRAPRWVRPLVGSPLLRGGIIGIVAIGVCWGLAAWIVPRFVDLNASGYRGPILEQIERQVGRSVELGHLSLRLWPRVTVRAEKVTIADDPSFATGSFVSAQVVELQVGLRSLLRGRPRVTGLVLEEPVVVLIKEVRERQAVWNWSTLQPFQEPAGQEELPAFDLVVERGRFTLVDRSVTPVTESLYEGITVVLEKFSPRQSFDFSMGVTMPGVKGGRVEIQGKAGPLDLAEWTRTPVKAMLGMREVEVRGLESLVGISSPRQGRLTLDLSLAGSLADSLRAQGTLYAEGVRLVAWGEPSRLPLELVFNLTVATSPVPRKGSQPPPFDLRLQVDEGEVALGKSRFRLRGGVRDLLTQPILDLTLDGAGIALASLLESAPAFGFGPPAGTRILGNADLSVKVVGQLPIPALDGKLVARDLRFEMAGLGQPVEVGQLTVLANPTLLSVTPFRTAVGGRSNVEIDELSLSDYREEPRFRMEVNTRQAHLEDLLQVAESMGIEPGVKGTGGITLRASVEATLAAERPRWAFEGGGSLRQATLQPTAWTQPVRIAQADLRLQGGRARIENFQAKIASTSLGGWLEVRQFERPTVNFDLQADQLIFSEWQSLVGEGTGAGRAGSGGITPTDLMVDGRLALGRLRLDGLTATDLHAQLAYRPQTLTLDPLSLSLYGGGYQGALRLDLASTPPGMAIKGRLSNVDLQPLLASLGQTRLIQGRLDSLFDLRGRGTDGADLARSLAGTGQLELRDGQLTSFDLMAQVERLGKLANLPTGGAGTAFRSLKTNLSFKEGQMRTDGLEVALDELTVTGEGRLQLVEPMRMDYSILAQLSPELTRQLLSSSQAAGRGGGGPGAIGQLVSSFFVEKDRLVIPLQVTGPFQQPTFGLDAAVLRKRARTNLIDNLRQRVLGGALGSPESPEAPAAPPEKKTEPSLKETLRETLERIRKRPPEKP
jgi:uncharacterized protein involved in outer membrane biogenesis